MAKLEEIENLDKPSVLTEIHKQITLMIEAVDHTAISDNMVRFWDRKTRKEQVVIGLFFQLFLDGEYLGKIIQKYRKI